MSDLLTDDFLNNLWVEKWNELVANGMDEREADSFAYGWAMEEYEKLAQ